MSENTKYNKLRDSSKLFVKLDSSDHIVYRWRCGRCGVEGYIFGKEAEEVQRKAYDKKLIKKPCKACRFPKVRIVLKEPSIRAIHLNNIRRRETDYSQDQQTYQNI